MISCFIIDDDPITRMEVENMVKKVSFLSLEGTASNAMDAFNYLLTNEPDLIFLDVVMPGLTGLELLKCLNRQKSKIILMTSEKKYAEDAFASEVTDFLSKPISPERFLSAVTKVRRNFTVAKNNEWDSNQMFVKVKSRLVKIIISDILYIESQGGHSYIHTTTETYEVFVLLKSLHEKLQNRNFMRVHNSYVVNLDKISSIEGTTLIIDGKLVPMSQVNVKNVVARLNILNKHSEYTPGN